MNPQPKQLLTIPGAIVIASAIIAMAVIWINKPVKVTTETTPDKQSAEKVINLAPITTTDHILGNPSAPVKIVEYSDPSCSYCKAFATIMTDISNQYGPNGKVAWIYRNFPLENIHPNANNESQALECAASVGNNDKFWAFVKNIYGIDTSGTSGLDPSRLPVIAKEIGLNVASFNECLKSGKFKNKVATDVASGITAGVSGTPTSFFVLDKPLNTAAEKYIANVRIQFRIPEEMLYTANENKLVVVGGALPKAPLLGLLGVILGN